MTKEVMSHDICFVAHDFQNYQFPETLHMTIGRSLRSRHNRSVILAFGHDQNIIIKKKTTENLSFFIFQISQHVLCARVRWLFLDSSGMNWPTRLTYDIYRRYSCIIIPVECLKALISLVFNWFFKGLINICLHLYKYGLFYCYYDS